MQTCIFCPNLLTPDTKPEHIILNALGGRKTTARVICSACNERFGGTIDKAAAEQAAVLRNMLVLESGSGKPPPTLRRIQAGSDVITLNDGSLEAVHRPFTVTERPDGTFNLQITASSVEGIAKHIPDIARRLRRTEEEVVALLANAQGTFITRRPGAVHFPLGFGGNGATQSLVKSCLVLWATIAGNGEVQSSAFDPARAFVLRGGKEFAFANVNLDARSMPHEDDIKRRFGEFFNLIYLRTNDTGRLVGHFTIYNIFGWQVVLAERGATPNRRLGLVNDPLDPVRWSDRIAEEIDVRFDWLNVSDFTDGPQQTQRRLAAAVKCAQKAAQSREFETIIRRSFERHGIKEDVVVSDPALLQRIIGDISHRTALHFLNIPYEEAVEGADIIAAMNAARANKDDD